MRPVFCEVGLLSFFHTRTVITVSVILVLLVALDKRYTALVSDQNGLINA